MGTTTVKKGQKQSGSVNCNFPKKYIHLIIGLSALLCAAVLFSLLVISRSQPGLPAGWRWVEIDNIGLAVPDTFQLNKGRGVDCEVWELSDQRTNIDIGVDCGGTRYDPSRPGYSERQIGIGENEAKIIFYQATVPDELWVSTTTWSLKYFVGVELTSPGLFRSRKTSLLASCRSEEERDKATSILKSIRLKKYTWSYFRTGP